eukprot:TRINITY_DN2655_c0_g1_i5.p1 TRINITY_DN2655_c0_g1~~TRINITY_DN2655_c0_g1_i5.p1  ORF type:complete len:6615 (+),score=556.99 TRINITY_DN2655_c0_g1_i5:105-19949(+)
MQLPALGAAPRRRPPSRSPCRRLCPVLPGRSCAGLPQIDWRRILLLGMCCTLLNAVVLSDEQEAKSVEDGIDCSSYAGSTCQNCDDGRYTPCPGICHAKICVRSCDSDCIGIPIPIQQRRRRKRRSARTLCSCGVTAGCHECQPQQGSCDCDSSCDDSCGGWDKSSCDASCDSGCGCDTCVGHRCASSGPVDNVCWCSPTLSPTLGPTGYPTHHSCNSRDCSECRPAGNGHCSKTHATTSTQFWNNDFCCECQCAPNHIDASVFLSVAPDSLSNDIPGWLDVDCSSVKIAAGGRCCRTPKSTRRSAVTTSVDSVDDIVCSGYQGSTCDDCIDSRVSPCPRTCHGGDCLHSCDSDCVHPDVLRGRRAVPAGWQDSVWDSYPSIPGCECKHVGSSCNCDHDCGCDSWWASDCDWPDCDSSCGCDEFHCYGAGCASEVPPCTCMQQPSTSSSSAHFNFCSYCKKGSLPDRRTDEHSDQWCKRGTSESPLLRQGTVCMKLDFGKECVDKSAWPHEHADRVRVGQQPESVVRGDGPAYVQLDEVHSAEYVDMVWVTGLHMDPTWCIPTVKDPNHMFQPIPTDNSLLRRPTNQKLDWRRPVVCPTEMFIGSHSAAKGRHVSKGCNRVNVTVTASNMAHNTNSTTISFVADWQKPNLFAYMDSNVWRDCKPCDESVGLWADYPTCLSHGAADPKCLDRFWTPHGHAKIRIDYEDNIFDEDGLECAPVEDKDVEYKPASASGWSIPLNGAFCDIVNKPDGSKKNSWCQFILSPPTPDNCQPGSPCLLADGQDACWDIRATDKVGHSTSMERCVVVDASPPRLGSQGPAGLPTYRELNGTVLERAAGALAPNDTAPGDSTVPVKSRRLTGYLPWPVKGPHGLFAYDPLVGGYVHCAGPICPLGDRLFLTTGTTPHSTAGGVFSNGEGKADTHGHDVLAVQRVNKSGLDNRVEVDDPHSGVRTVLGKKAPNGRDVNFRPTDPDAHLRGRNGTWEAHIDVHDESGAANKNLELTITNYAGVQQTTHWQVRIDSTHPHTASASTSHLTGRAVIGVVQPSGVVHFGTERRGIWSTSGGALYESQYVAAWGTEQPHDIFLPRAARLHVNYTGVFLDTESSQYKDGMPRLWQYRVEVHKMQPVPDVLTTLALADTELYVRVANRSEGKVALSTCTVGNPQGACRWLVDTSPTRSGHYYIRFDGTAGCLSSAGGTVHVGVCLAADSLDDLWVFEPSPTRERHWYVRAAGADLYLYGGRGGVDLSLAPCPKHTTSATGDTPECQWQLSNWLIERQRAVGRGRCDCDRFDKLGGSRVYDSQRYCPREGDSVCARGCFSDPSGAYCIAELPPAPTVWDRVPLPAASQWAGPIGWTTERPAMYGLPVRPWDAPLAFDTDDHPEGCSEWEHNGHRDILGDGTAWCRSMLRGPDGTELRVVVVGCNFARQCSALSSVRAVMDDSGAQIVPLPGGEGCERLAQATGNDLGVSPCTLYHFRWRMRDPHSGIAVVKWMLVQPHSRSTLKVVHGDVHHPDFNCTPPVALRGDCRLGWCDCITRISWTGSPGDPGLTPGERYEFTLLVTNGGGLVTDYRWEFIADTSAIRGGVLLDGTGGADVEYISTPRLCATWYGFQDPDSEVRAMSVRWLLANGSVIVPRTNVPPSEKFVCETAPLVEGEKYFAELTAASYGGEAVKRSNGVVYAPSAPVPASMDIVPSGRVDGSRAPQVGQVLRAHWEPFATVASVPVHNYTAVLVRTGFIRVGHGRCTGAAKVQLASCHNSNISAEDCLRHCGGDSSCIGAAVHGDSCHKYYTGGADPALHCFVPGARGSIVGSDDSQDGDCFARAAIPGGPVSLYRRQENTTCTGHDVIEAVTLAYNCSARCASMPAHRLRIGDQVLYSASGWGTPSELGTVSAVHRGWTVDLSRTIGATAVRTVSRWPLSLISSADSERLPAACLGGVPANALCLTEPECRALCDATAGCVGVVMHVSLQRCQLKAASCTQGLTSSPEWDFLHKSPPEVHLPGSERSALLPAAEFQGEQYILKVVGRSPTGLSNSSTLQVRPDSSVPLCCQGRQWYDLLGGVQRMIPTVATLEGLPWASNRSHLCLRVLGLYDDESGLTALIDVRDASGGLIGSGTIADGRGSGGAGDWVLRSALQGCVRMRPAPDGARLFVTVRARNRAGGGYPEFAAPLDGTGNVVPLGLDASPPEVSAPEVPATEGGVLAAGPLSVRVACRDQASGVASLQLSTRLAPANASASSAGAAYSVQANRTCTAHVLDQANSPLRCLARCGDSMGGECSGNSPQNAAHLCAAASQCSEICSSMPSCYGVAVNDTGRLCRLLGSGCSDPGLWDEAHGHHLEMKEHMSGVLVNGETFANPEDNVERRINLDPPSSPFFVSVDCVNAAGLRSTAEAGPFVDGGHLVLGRPRVFDANQREDQYTYFGSGSHLRVAADVVHFGADVPKMRVWWTRKHGDVNPKLFYQGEAVAAVNMPRRLPPCEWLVAVVSVQSSGGSTSNATSEPFMVLQPPNATLSLSNSSSGQWSVVWAAESCVPAAHVDLQLRRAVLDVPGSAQGPLAGHTSFRPGAFSGEVTVHTSTQRPLHNGDHLIAVANVTDAAGQGVFLVSEARVFDSSSPDGTLWWDGVAAATHSADNLTLHYSIADVESGVASLRALTRCASCPGAPLVWEGATMQWPSPNGGLAVSFGEAAQSGQQYDAEVRVANGAGATAVFKARPVVFSARPPSFISSPTVGPIPGEHAGFARSADLHFAVNATDADTGEFSAFVSLLTSGGSVVLPVRAVALHEVSAGLREGQIDVSDAGQGYHHGGRYKLNVTLTNAAGLSSSEFSREFTAHLQRHESGSVLVDCETAGSGLACKCSDGLTAEWDIGADRARLSIMVAASNVTTRWAVVQSTRVDRKSWGSFSTLSGAPAAETPPAEPWRLCVEPAAGFASRPACTPDLQCVAAPSAGVLVVPQVWHCPSTLRFAWKGVVTGEVQSKLDWRLNGGAWTAFNNRSTAHPTALTNGSYMLQGRVTTIAGEATTAATFQVDLTPCSVTAVTPELQLVNGRYYTQSAKTLPVRVEAPRHATCRVMVSGSTDAVGSDWNDVPCNSTVSALLPSAAADVLERGGAVHVLAQCTSVAHEQCAATSFGATAEAPHAVSADLQAPRIQELSILEEPLDGRCGPLLEDARTSGSALRNVLGWETTTHCPLRNAERCLPGGVGYDESVCHTRFRAVRVRAQVSDGASGVAWAVVKAGGHVVNVTDPEPIIERELPLLSDGAETVIDVCASDRAGNEGCASRTHAGGADAGIIKVLSDVTPPPPLHVTLVHDCGSWALIEWTTDLHGGSRYIVAVGSAVGKADWSWWRRATGADRGRLNVTGFAIHRTQGDGFATVVAEDAAGNIAVGNVKLEQSGGGPVLGNLSTPPTASPSGSTSPQWPGCRQLPAPVPSAHVVDGPGPADADFLTHPGTVACSWSLAGSGAAAATAMWGVGTYPGADDVIPLRNVSTTSVSSAVELLDGVRYYCVVRVVHGGASMVFTSNGATADLAFFAPRASLGAPYQPTRHVAAEYSCRAGGPAHVSNAVAYFGATCPSGATGASGAPSSSCPTAGTQDASGGTWVTADGDRGVLRHTASGDGPLCFVVCCTAASGRAALAQARTVVDGAPPEVQDLSAVARDTGEPLPLGRARGPLGAIPLAAGTDGLRLQWSAHGSFAPVASCMLHFGVPPFPRLSLRGAGAAQRVIQEPDAGPAPAAPAAVRAVFASEAGAELSFAGTACSTKQEEFNRLGAAAALPLDAAPYTIEFFIRTTSTADATLIRWGTASAGRVTGLRLERNSSVVRQLGSRVPGADLLGALGKSNDTGYSGLADDQWHHIGATWNGSTRAIFVDYEQIASDAPGANSSAAGSTSNFSVGCSVDGDDADSFIGSIRDVRVFDGARQPAAWTPFTFSPTGGAVSDLADPTVTLVQGSDVFEFDGAALALRESDLLHRQVPVDVVCLSEAGVASSRARMSFAVHASAPSAGSVQHAREVRRPASGGAASVPVRWSGLEDDVVDVRHLLLGALPNGTTVLNMTLPADAAQPISVPVLDLLATVNISVEACSALGACTTGYSPWPLAITDAGGDLTVGHFEPSSHCQLAAQMRCVFSSLGAVRFSWSGFGPESAIDRYYITCGAYSFSLSHGTGVQTFRMAPSGLALPEQFSIEVVGVDRVGVRTGALRGMVEIDARPPAGGSVSGTVEPLVNGSVRVQCDWQLPNSTGALRRMVHWSVVDAGDRLSAMTRRQRAETDGLSAALVTPGPPRPDWRCKVSFASLAGVTHSVSSAPLWRPQLPSIAVFDGATVRSDASFTNALAVLPFSWDSHGHHEAPVAGSYVVMHSHVGSRCVAAPINASGETAALLCHTKCGTSAAGDCAGNPVGGADAAALCATLAQCRAACSRTSACAGINQHLSKPLCYLMTSACTTALGRDTEWRFVPFADGASLSDLQSPAASGVAEAEVPDELAEGGHYSVELTLCWAGLRCETAESDGVTVDRHAPEGGLVTVTGMSGEFVPNCPQAGQNCAPSMAGSVMVLLQDFVDFGSGLAGYQVVIRSHSGKPLSDVIDIGLDTAAAVHVPGLFTDIEKNFAQCQAHVSVVDFAGNKFTKRSALTLIEAAPRTPSNATARTAVHQDGTVSVSWGQSSGERVFDAADMPSHVHAEICLAHIASGTTAASPCPCGVWKRVNETTIASDGWTTTVTRLDGLRDGELILACVRGVSGVGLASTPVKAPPVLFDRTPPEVGAVHVPRWAAASAIGFRFDRAQDPESGIERCEFAAEYIASGDPVTDVSGCVPSESGQCIVHVPGNVTVNLPGWKHGVDLAGKLTCWNKVGFSTTVEATAAWDHGAPQFQLGSSTEPHLCSDAPFSVSWPICTSASGTARYEVALEETNTTVTADAGPIGAGSPSLLWRTVADFEDVGLSTEHTFSASVRSAGLLRYRVRCWSHAGRSADLLSRSLRTLRARPVVPSAIADGPPSNATSRPEHGVFFPDCGCDTCGNSTRDGFLAQFDDVHLLQPGAQRRCARRCIDAPGCVRTALSAAGCRLYTKGAALRKGTADRTCWASVQDCAQVPSSSCAAGALRDVSAQVSRAEARAHWAAPFENLQSLEACLGRSSADCSVLDWTPQLLSSTDVALYGLQLRDQHAYVLRLRACSVCGHCTTVSTDGFLVSSRHPAQPAVYPGPVTTGPKVKWMAPSTEAIMHWSGSSESVECEWAIGADAMSVSLMDWSVIDCAGGQESRRVFLGEGHNVYHSVRVCNSMGLCSVGISRPLRVSQAAAVVEAVSSERLGHDITAVRKGRPWGAKWWGFHFLHPNAEITHYDWAVDTHGTPTLTVTLPTATASGTGTRTASLPTATVSSTLPTLTSTHTHTLPTVTGTVTATVTLPAATGTLTATGTATGTVTLLTAALTTTETATLPSVGATLTSSATVTAAATATAEPLVNASTAAPSAASAVGSRRLLQATTPGPTQAPQVSQPPQGAQPPQAAQPPPWTDPPLQNQSATPGALPPQASEPPPPPTEPPQGQAPTQAPGPDGALPAPCHRTKHGVVCDAWEGHWDVICTAGNATVHEEHVTLPDDCLERLEAGHMYRVLVRAFYEDGAILTAVSNGVTVTEEVPIPDGVFLPPLITAFSGLRVSWRPFRTGEARVARYQVRLRARQGGFYIVDESDPTAAATRWVDLGLDTSFVFARPTLLGDGSLTLDDIEEVRAEVRACNAAGLCGTGVSAAADVLTTRPQPPRVWDGHEADGYGKNNDQDLTTDNTTLKFGFQPCQWAATLHHEWCIGTRPGQCNVVRDWQPVNVSTTGSRSGLEAAGLSLERDQVYYVTVRCTTEIGISTWGASSGVRLIVPQSVYIEGECGSVYNGLDDGVSKPFQSDPSNFSAHWTDQHLAFGVDGPGEYYFTAELRNQYGAPVVLARNVGYAQHVQWSGLSLRHGDTYTMVVELLSERGRCVSTSGIPTTLDTTRPEAPKVSAPAVVTDPSAAVLTVLSPGRDHESGIADVQVAVGTTPYGTQAQLYQDVGVRLRTIQIRTALLSGVQYWATVLVRNGAGLTNATLVSFHTDWAPPSITVAARLVPSAGGEGILAEWDVTDDSAGPVSVTIELVSVTAAAVGDSQPLLSEPASPAGHRVFDLPRGVQAFQIRVIARDEHGNSATRRSDLVLRPDPPYCGDLVFHSSSPLRVSGGAVHSSGQDVSINWDAVINGGSAGITQLSIKAEADGQVYAGGQFSGQALCSDPYPLEAPASKADTELTVNGMSANGAWCESPSKNTIVWHNEVSVTSLTVDTALPCTVSRFVRPRGAIRVAWTIRGLSSVDSVSVLVGAAEGDGEVAASIASPTNESGWADVRLPAELQHGAAVWVTVRALTKAGTDRLRSVHLTVDALTPDANAMRVEVPRVVYADAEAVFYAQWSGAVDLDSGVCGTKSAVTAAGDDCSTPLGAAPVMPRNDSHGVMFTAPRGPHQVCIAVVDGAGNVAAPVSSLVDIRTDTQPLPPPRADLMVCRDGSFRFSLRRPGFDPTTAVPYNLSVTVDGEEAALEEVNDNRTQVVLYLPRSIDNRSSLLVVAAPRAASGAPIPWLAKLGNLRHHVDVAALAHSPCLLKSI